MKKLILIALGAFCINANAQEAVYNSKSKKAIRLYEEGLIKYKSRDMQGAINAWTKATTEDTAFVEPHFRLGTLARIEKQNDLAKKYLEVVVRNMQDSSKYDIVFFDLAELYFGEANYDKACRYYEIYNRLGPENKLKMRVEAQLGRCGFIKEHANDNSDAKPVRLQQPLNQFQYQYFPSITLDEGEMYFTTRPSAGNEDIFVTKKKDGNWSVPVSISEKINTLKNEGTGTISGDGKTLVFTACNTSNGYGSCDLYISYKSGDEWTAPENLGVNINSGAWESQPSLSPDGRTIYFVSDRKGGRGRQDIWRSRKDENNNWTVAENLGPEVNTNQDDLSPFIHPNGTTLFFASSGHLGFGGTDLFYTDFDNNTWSKPKNLGHPINTQMDESSIVITASANKAYYSVDFTVAGDPYKSSILLYEIDLADIVKLDKKATFMKGTVYDSETKSKLSASIEVIDLETGGMFYKAESDKENGSYMISLAEKKKYAFFVNKEGYLTKSFNYELNSIKDIKENSLDIYLDKIKTGSKMVLRNIYFATNSYQLDDLSKVELNKFVSFLNSNPKQKIEISGHTDDVGDDKANMELSLNRAKSVMEYLIKNGIDKTRMQFKGYGETTPIIENSSDANRAQNRRIEVKML